MTERSAELWCGRFAGRSERAGETEGRPAANPRPFPLPGTAKRFGRDRTGALRHLKAEVTLDFERRRVDGTVTCTIEALAAGLHEVALDAGALSIRAARVDGREAPWSYDGEKLRVALPERVPGGRRVEVAVDYGGVPARGLYFVGPDARDPDRLTHAWSQGQDEDNRYWLPCPDYPDQKATTEIIARVPRGFRAISNGALVSHDDIDGQSVWHWRQDVPHVTYLITLCAGAFVELTDTAAGTPLQFYVAPGREADARRSLGNTGRMVERFSGVLGVPYPYPKYAQVCVADFIFGGMENTSATTLTDVTLHDERAHLDYSSDPLVAHELAHQWFGDLVTCRTWAHAWLNEGFATFMETVWLEHDRGEDEAGYDRYRQGQEYLQEDAESYRRPIVAREYEAPVDIFDAHLYQKAGRVLHWLRSLLGDAPFWAGVRAYLERHRGGLVETADFRRALEDASGRDLGQAFDDWIYHGGHPALKLGYRYDTGDATVELTLAQTQAGDEVTPGFTLDVPIVVHTAAGAQRVVVPLDQKQRTVHVRVDGAPTMVRVDPGDTILKTLELDLPVGLLTAQLTDDPDPIGRIRAAQALAKPAKAGGLAAVIAALAADRFWGVRAECARALAAEGSDPARDALVAAAGREAHPKARRAVARALGRFRDAAVVAPLRALLASDASYYVRAEAAQAPGATRQPGVLPDLERGLTEASHADAIRAGALRGLGATRDPEALPLLRAWTRDHASEQARAAAASGRGTLARHAADPLRTEVREDLAELARDRSLRVRATAVRALGALPGAASAGILRAVRDGDAEARVRREAAEQLRALTGTGAARVRSIEDAFEELRADHRRLAGRVQALESLLGRGKSGN